MDSDIENRFRPQTNELLHDGEAIRWIALDERGRAVGRIAAFYNRELVKASEYQPTGGCGFFESIDDQRVADLHTYLRELAEGLFPENVYERVKRLKEEPRYRFEHMDKRRIEKYADDFLEVYNKGWAGFSGVKPIDREHAFALLKKMRPIIDEHLMYFAYYDDRPIGFFLMIPDLNGVIGPLKGRFGLLQKFRFLWRLKVTKKATRIFALIFGVVPEFQGKGIESGMIYTFEQDVAKKIKFRYKSLELAWIGDFNPVMMRMVENYVCAQKHKMHTTYRYLFDRTKEFKRAPRMNLRKREPATAAE